MAVAQDPDGDRVHPVAGRLDQGREGLAIAAPGSLDEFFHRHSLDDLRRAAPITQQ